MNGENEDASRRNSEIGGGSYRHEIGGQGHLIGEGYVDALPTADDTMVVSMHGSGSSKKKKRSLPGNPNWADAEDSFTILSSYVGSNSSERIRKMVRQLECEMFSEYQQVQHLVPEDDKNKKKGDASAPIPAALAGDNNSNNNNNNNNNTTVDASTVNNDTDAINMVIGSNRDLLLQEDIAPACVSVAAVPEIVENVI